MKTRNAYELFVRGRTLLDGNHPAQAALVLEKAKVIEPAKGSIREALGRAYFNYGEWESAGREFSRAVEIDSTNHYAHFGLALALARLGRVARAIGHLRLALAMEPDSEDYAAAYERLAG